MSYNLMVKKFIGEQWFLLIVVLVLIGALQTYPYFYYQLTRWLVTISSCYLINKYAHNKQSGWMLVFVVLAILFNPIAPLYFSKAAWHVIDIVGALIFMASFVTLKYEGKN